MSKRSSIASFNNNGDSSMKHQFQLQRIFERHKTNLF